jgi:hypothetical protein
MVWESNPDICKVSIGGMLWRRPVRDASWGEPELHLRFVLGGRQLGKKRKKSKKRTVRASGRVNKVTAAVIATAAVTGVSTGVSTAAINFVQQSAENLESFASHLLGDGTALQQVRASSSGGQYLFGQAWRLYAQQSQGAVESVATDIVNLAQAEAGIKNLSPADKHVYMQWVLIGNIDPSQAVNLLAGDDIKSADESIGSLVELMTKNSLLTWTAANYSQSETNYQLDAADYWPGNLLRQQMTEITSGVYDWSQNPDSEKMGEIASSILRLGENPYFKNIVESAPGVYGGFQLPASSSTEDRDSAPEDPHDDATPV